MLYEKTRSKNEIKNLCLIAWESLRRNTEYRNEYTQLKDGLFLDLEAIDVFCEKWKVPMHLNPDTDSAELIRPREGETQSQTLKRVEFLLMGRAIDTLKSG